MTESLGRPEWMTARATAAVFDTLEAAGGPGCARFVGGCVRNAVLGLPVDDLDIATTLTPPAVTRALIAAGLKAIPTGADHGTITAVSCGRPFEITTLRRDVATDGRRAVVAFTTDWAEDAGRRDFTLNALYAERDGAIRDPLGCGLADARAGRIVFVGDAGQRIREDYLRILRFFRFLAWYGRGPADAAALAACAALKEGIARLAAERISKELLKLLAAPEPRDAVALMAETGVLAEILPEAGRLDRFAALVAQGTDEPVLRLAALTPDDPEAALETARRLRLSNSQRDRLAAAKAADPPLSAAMGPAAARAAIYRAGAQAFADRVRLARAAQDGAPTAWAALLELARDWKPPKFPLSGADAAAAGIPRGPQVGRALRAVEDWWVAEDFPADLAPLRARLAAAGRDDEA